MSRGRAEIPVVYVFVINCKVEIEALRTPRQPRSLLERAGSRLGILGVEASKGSSSHLGGSSSVEEIIMPSWAPSVDCDGDVKHSTLSPRSRTLTKWIRSTAIQIETNRVLD